MAPIRSVSSAGWALTSSDSSVDDRPLLGQVAQRVHADERLDPADAGPDGRLAGHGRARRSARSAGRGCRRTARATTGRRSRRRAPARRRSRRTGPARRTRGPRPASCTARDTGRSCADARLATSSISLRVPRDSAPAPGEVQPQVAGLVVRAGLQRRRAEHLAQRGVHDVGAGVRLAGRRAATRVDLGLHAPRPRATSPDYLDRVHDQALDRPLDVERPRSCAPSPVITPSSAIWPPDSA